MRNLANRRRHLPVSASEAVESTGAVRITLLWQLPKVMCAFGVDLGELLDAAGVRKDAFEDRENEIPYASYGRLLAECELRSNCEHIALLIAQHTRLADLGLAGQVAQCAENAGNCSAARGGRR